MTKKLTSVLFVLTLIITSPAKAQLPSFADLTEKLLPSVVNISTTTLEDNPEGTQPETETLGSGFIISKDGYIVTNQHVINKAKVINIILYNNEKCEAEVIGEDKQTDLALLKISTPTELIPVVFGDSDALRVGDWVLAIGNPFGLGGSLLVLFQQNHGILNRVLMIILFKLMLQLIKEILVDRCLILKEKLSVSIALSFQVRENLWV